MSIVCIFDKDSNVTIYDDEFTGKEIYLTQKDSIGVARDILNQYAGVFDKS